MKRRCVEALLVFLVLAVLSWVLQWRSGAYESEFGGHPDEAAHYVTGLMVRDYLSRGFPGPPMRFAEDYYDHYPKVALGHYPPVFYMMYAPWALVFSPSRSSTLVFMVFVSACLALVLFVFMRGQFGFAWALGSSAILLLLPVVQQHTSTMMSDNALSLFCLLAAVGFVRYLERPSFAAAMTFGVLASVAILTKGSGLMLAFLPPVCVLLTRRFELLKRWSYWAILIPIVVVCVPWMVLTYKISSEGFPNEWGIAYTVHAVPWVFRRVLAVLGYGICAGAVVGLLAMGYSGHLKRNREGPFYSVVLGLPVCVLFLYVIVPIGVEPRYVIPALAPLLILAAKGVRDTVGFVTRSKPRHRDWVTLAVVSVIVVVFFAESFEVPPKRFSGYRAVVDTIISEDTGQPSEILISSDARGEGALIAEVAMADGDRPSYVVHRSSKVLASSDWMGRDYSSAFRSDTELQDYLEESRIDWVIVDGSVHPGYRREHHSLLEKTVHGAPGSFVTVGAYTMERSSGQIKNAIILYSISRRGD